MHFRPVALLVLSAGVLAMMAACAAAPAERSVRNPSPDRESTPRARPDRVAGEYILTVVPGTGMKQLSYILSAFEPERIEDLGRNLWLVHLRKDPGLAVLQKRLRRERSVRAVQPNFLYYKMKPPSRLDRPAPY